MDEYVKLLSEMFLHEGEASYPFSMMLEKPTWNVTAMLRFIIGLLDSAISHPHPLKLILISKEIMLKFIKSYCWGNV